jgi:hypothetical protein
LDIQNTVPGFIFASPDAGLIPSLQKCGQPILDPDMHKEKTQRLFWKSIHIEFLNQINQQKYCTKILLKN